MQSDRCVKITVDRFDGIDRSGSLAVVNMTTFDVKRSFWVWGCKEGERRGRHAHRKTRQIMVCLRGEIIVNAKYLNEQEETFTLSEPHEALDVPAMTWTEETYSKGAILLVFCNTEYDKSDYIENILEFYNEV